MVLVGINHGTSPLGSPPTIHLHMMLACWAICFAHILQYVRGPLTWETTAHALCTGDR